MSDTISEKNVLSMKRQDTDTTTNSEPCAIQTPCEGGSEAWLTVLGSFLVYYASFGLINSFGYFSNYYKTNFLYETPASTIAFIGTLQILLMYLVGTVSGALCDTYGVKYLYLVSGLGISSSLFILSFVPPGGLWQTFVVQGLFMGVSFAFAVQPALTVTGQHFKRRRALVMGLVTGGCALGGVLYPIMFTRLEPVIGFQRSLQLAATKTLFCYTIAQSISTSRPTRRSIREVWGTLLDYRGFLDTRYAVLCAGSFIAQIGIWVPNYYIESYAATLEPNTPLKGYFLPLINGSSIFGMIVGGLVGDSIGRLNLLYPVTMNLGLLCSIWVLSTSIHTLVVFCCLFGFFSGMFVGLIPPVVSQISPDERLGARIGAFYSLIAISSLIGTPVGGALINGNARADYQNVILYAGGTLFVGALVMLGSRLLHDRSLRTKW